MSTNIFRTMKNKENPYVSINNTIFFDERTSLKLKGLVGFMLAQKDDWVFNRKNMVKRFKDGEDSLSSAIKEGQELGYILVEKVRDEKGRVAYWQTLVFETPQLCQEYKEKRGQYAVSPERENPDLENPESGKPPHITNTKITNTKSNKEEKNKTKKAVTTRPEESGDLSPPSPEARGACSLSVKRKERSLTNKKVSEEDIQAVFAYWVLKLKPSGKALLGKKRRSRIEKALKLGYTVDDLKQAIDGNAQSAYHQGKNDRGSIYNDIELILRDESKIDGFINLSQKTQQPNKERTRFLPNRS